MSSEMEYPTSLQVFKTIGLATCCFNGLQLKRVGLDASNEYSVNYTKANRMSTKLTLQHDNLEQR